MNCCPIEIKTYNLSNKCLDINVFLIQDNIFLEPSTNWVLRQDDSENIVVIGRFVMDSDVWVKLDDNEQKDAISRGFSIE